MQTEYLKDFVTTAQKMNYSRAADSLYISHSSLFKHIKALEADLGSPLFERDGKKLVLSAFGQQFLPHAIRLLNLEESCMDDLMAWRKNAANLVRVASEYRIWSSVYRFQKKYPDYSFHYLEFDSILETENMMSRGACDFALLCDAELDEDEFEKIPFLKDHMAVILPVNHPLANKKTLSLSQIANEDFVMIPDSSPHYRRWNIVITPAEFTPHIVFTCPRGTAVVECIAENGGCSIMLEDLTKSQHNSTISVVRLEPEVEVSIDIWKLRSRKLLPAAKTFLDSLIDEKNAIFETEVTQ